MKLDAYDINRHNYRNKVGKFFRMQLVYLHHIVVIKTTLAGTAAYNANTHPECFTLANTDQPVTKINYCNVGKQQQKGTFLGCG